MRKILIATTNPGKFREFTAQCTDLAFEFVDLKKARLDKLKVDEPFETTWENAAYKARIYGQKSGLLTISEDTGFFVKALGGKPGIKARRFGPTAENRNKKILKALAKVKGKKRSAYFETHACLYDPALGRTVVFKGRVDGFIAAKMSRAAGEGLGYDSIFYYPPFKKTFAEVPTVDKNMVSHRGQVVNEIKFYLVKNYGLQRVVAAAALIVKNRRLLMTLRRDSRPEFDKKWEFPGGLVDSDEQVAEAALRETFEETGYRIKILETIPQIYSGVRRGQKLGDYQVFIQFFICAIKSGKFHTSDLEVRGHGWFTLKEVLKTDILGLNKNCVQENIKLLKKYID